MFCLKGGLEPYEGLKRKKQSCGLFLAKEREAGTVGNANGRRANSMLAALAVKQTASPVASTK